MNQYISKIKYYKNNSSITFVMFLILSIYFLSTTFYFINKYTIILKNTAFYDAFDLILINPDLDVKEQIDENNKYVTYQYTYEEVNGEFLYIVTTTMEGLSYGFPIYDGELNLVKIENITHIEQGIIYSNHPTVNNFGDMHVVTPDNIFVKKDYDTIISFRIDNNVREGTYYFIKDGIRVRNYLSEKNRMNDMANYSFTGESKFLKDSYLSKYQVFLFIFAFLTLIPVVVTVFLFKFFINYQMSLRFDEIIIRHIYFAKNRTIIFSYSLEYMILIFSSTMVGMLIAFLFMPIELEYALLLFMFLIIIYSMMTIQAIWERVKRLRTKDSVEFYRRRIE